MKAFVVLALIGSAIAAPAEEVQDVLRTKKSAYGASSYGAPPCAGASAAGPVAPVALYLSAAPQPHYREDEHLEQHMGQERSYYGDAGAAASAPSSAITYSGAGGTGSAVGVFPNAKVGGCAVPILFSCSPSVISGHLSQAGYAAPAYRAQGVPHMREMQEKAMTEEVHKVEDDTHAGHHHHHVIADFPMHHHHPQNGQL